MKSTLEELEKIKKEKINEEKRIQLALELNICTECSAFIITKHQTTGFLGLGPLYIIKTCTNNHLILKEEYIELMH